MLAEQLVLAEHDDRFADFLRRGGEVIVPEKRHLLVQGRAVIKHAAESPVARFLHAADVFALDLLASKLVRMSDPARSRDGNTDHGVSNRFSAYLWHGPHTIR